MQENKKIHLEQKDDCVNDLRIAIKSIQSGGPKY